MVLIHPALAFCRAGSAELDSLPKRFYGQATKGARRMPWHWEAKKDVASCDKPRGAAKQALSPGDFRMGKPI